MTLRIAFFCAAAMAFSIGAPAAAPQLDYEVIAAYPHDRAAFTQGLLLREGILYESSGGYGHSSLSAKNWRSGSTIKTRALPADIFAEGLARVGNELFLLSWRERRGFVFDLDLRLRREFHYTGEGWGLASDGTHLWMSDGSATLRELDSKSFRELKRVQVLDDNATVTKLNELEFVHGLIYANIWQDERVAVVEPASGAVRAWIDLSSLRLRFPRPPQWDPNDDVLNGIAWNPANGHFLVTGKHWPVLFELKIATGTAGK